MPYIITNSYSNLFWYYEQKKKKKNIYRYINKTFSKQFFFLIIEYFLILESFPFKNYVLNIYLTNSKFSMMKTKLKNKLIFSVHLLILKIVYKCIFFFSKIYYRFGSKSLIQIHHREITIFKALYSLYSRNLHNRIRDND